MPASPATIEQLARGVVRNADAEDALRALAALREELAKTESELVARAVQGGCTWSQIASALGVSKQAAHRKHRAACEPATAAEGDSPKILVTAESRRSIAFAREEAKRQGHPSVGTEHLLLGILRCKRSHAVRALNALGVTLVKARLAIEPTLLDIDSSSCDDAGATAAGRHDITPHARRILEGSLREAVKRREGFIGVEHLLLALLSDERNGAVQTLRRLGATPAAIRAQLEHQWQAVAREQGVAS